MSAQNLEAIKASAEENAKNMRNDKVEKPAWISARKNRRQRSVILSKTRDAVVGADDPDKKPLDSVESNTSGMKRMKSKARKSHVDLIGMIGDLDVSLAEQIKDNQSRRARKLVQRFAPSAQEEKKAFVVEPGTGTNLGHIPYIADQINDKKRKLDDFKILHKFLFDRMGTKMQVKKNIRLFSGFNFEAGTTEYATKKEKLIKLKKVDLKEICSILGLKNGNNATTVNDIMEFCLNPTDSGRQSKSSSTKSASKATKRKADDTSADEDDQDSDIATPSKKKMRRNDTAAGANNSKAKYRKVLEETEEETEFGTSDEPSVGSTNSVSALTSKTDDTKGKSIAKIDTNTSASSGTNDTAEQQQPDTTAAVKKKLVFPKFEGKLVSAKPFQLNRPTDDDGDTSELDKGTTKNVSNPTDEQLKETVKNLIEGKDLRKLTMKMIFENVCSAYPAANLKPRRSAIKALVKQLI